MKKESKQKRKDKEFKEDKKIEIEKKKKKEFELKKSGEISEKEKNRIIELAEKAYRKNLNKWLNIEYDDVLRSKTNHHLSKLFRIGENTEDNGGKISQVLNMQKFSGKSHFKQNNLIILKKFETQKLRGSFVLLIFFKMNYIIILVTLRNPISSYISLLDL
jgi:hypothetical protein